MNRTFAVMNQPIRMKQAEEAKLKSEAETAAAAKAAFETTYNGVEKTKTDLSNSKADELYDMASRPIVPVDPAKCTAAGTGIAGGTACSPSSFMVMMKDSYGRRVLHGGAEIKVRVSPGVGVGGSDQDGTVKDMGDGTYMVTYVVPKRGNYMLHVECNGKGIMGSPFPVFFSHGTTTTGGHLGFASQATYPNLMKSTMPNYSGGSTGILGMIPGLVPGASGGVFLPGIGSSLGEICREYFNRGCVKIDCKLNHPQQSVLLPLLAASTSLETLTQMPMARSAAAMKAAKAGIAARAFQAHDVKAPARVPAPAPAPAPAQAQAQAQAPAPAPDQSDKDASGSADKEKDTVLLKKTVQVSNLSPLLTVEQLKKVFSFCGTVVESSINESKHFAYIEYTQPEEATAALALNNMYLGSRPLNVEMAKSLPPKPVQLAMSSMPLTKQQEVAFQQASSLQQALNAQEEATRALSVKTAIELAAARAAEISKSLKVYGDYDKGADKNPRSLSPFRSRSKSRSKSRSPISYRKRRRSCSLSPQPRFSRHFRSRSPLDFIDDVDRVRRRDYDFSSSGSLTSRSPSPLRRRSKSRSKSRSPISYGNRRRSCSLSPRPRCSRHYRSRSPVDLIDDLDRVGRRDYDCSSSDSLTSRSLSPLHRRSKSRSMSQSPMSCRKRRRSCSLSPRPRFSRHFRSRSPVEFIDDVDRVRRYDYDCPSSGSKRYRSGSTSPNVSESNRDYSGSPRWPECSKYETQNSYPRGDDDGKIKHRIRSRSKSAEDRRQPMDQKERIRDDKWKRRERWRSTLKSLDFEHRSKDSIEREIEDKSKVWRSRSPEYERLSKDKMERDREEKLIHELGSKSPGYEHPSKDKTERERGAKSIHESRSISPEYERHSKDKIERGREEKPKHESGFISPEYKHPSKDKTVREREAKPNHESRSKSLVYERHSKDKMERGREEKSKHESGSISPEYEHPSKDKTEREGEPQSNHESKSKSPEYERHSKDKMERGREEKSKHESGAIFPEYEQSSEDKPEREREVKSKLKSGSKSPEYKHPSENKTEREREAQLNHELRSKCPEYERHSKNKIERGREENSRHLKGKGSRSISAEYGCQLKSEIERPKDENSKPRQSKRSRSISPEDIPYGRNKSPRHSNEKDNLDFSDDGNCTNKNLKHNGVGPDPICDQESDLKSKLLQNFEDDGISSAICRSCSFIENEEDLEIDITGFEQESPEAEDPDNETINTPIVGPEDIGYASISDEDDFSLDENSTRMFVMLWKKACRENNASEVFRRMLQFYKINQRKEKAKDWFLSHPFIGVFNVAVTSIERGMWDSMCNDLQDFVHHGVVDIESEKHTLCERVEVEPPKTDTVGKIKNNIKAVTVDDIVQKLSTYLGLDHKILSNIELSFELKLSFLRKLCKCEFWLAKQFSVKKFKSLGHGKFFRFLEKHVGLLHDALRNSLIVENKSPLEVCMLEQQLAVLLSQAANGLGEDKNLTKEMISPLLTTQFPSVNFVIAEKGVSADFLDDVKKKGGISTCVLFSAPLLTKYRGDKTLGSVTSNDAIKLLLKAPMLSDLISWTHWDIVFAPSLGPLVRWLLNEVKPEKLLCLVTKDGKVIRIDNKANIESFSEACLRGCSFQTAVQLLSVLSLYGGEEHVPLSLLRRHARQAFEVISKKSGEVEVNENSSSVYKKAKVAASIFFIDCLGYLPSEFHVFAADILLSGLQFVLKDAPLVILQNCQEIGPRHMLHNIGLSLGILEWINDYHLFSSSMTNDSTICLGVVDRDANNETLQMNHGSANLTDQIPINPNGKPGTYNSLSPIDWNNAPGFNFPHSDSMKMQSGVYNIKTAEKSDHGVTTEMGAGCNGSATPVFDPTSITATEVVPDSVNLGVNLPSDGGNTHRILPNAQAIFTGRLGEHVAYNYFSAHAGTNNKVTWVNQHIESGLPYDLVIEDVQQGLEYIEVKATRSSDKHWFHISLREWLFAVEQGERFTIAHVIVSGDEVARINMFKNPAKLCQLGKLQLAILMPKLLEEFSTT